MKCPECEEELERINCYSECLQKCSIEDDGTVHDFGEPEPFPYDSHYECPECGYEITHLVREVS